MRLGVRAALVDGEWLPGDVDVDAGHVRAVGVMGSSPRSIGVAVPGLIDMQVNGFAGVDFAETDREGFEQAGRALLQAGTTAYLPTFITAAPAAMRAGLAQLAPTWSGRAQAGLAETVHGDAALAHVGRAQDELARARHVATRPRPAISAARILGAHLEGPFLSPARMAAHDPRFRAAPDLRLLDELLAAGPVRRITLAPELDGALALVDVLHARGVAVAAGHTDATAAEAHAAFDRGVTTVTHLYNAMPAGTAREPSIVAAALAREDVCVELIVDGHHLAPDTVMATWRAARGRLALVSDAVAAAGMAPGEFTLGGRTVRADTDGAVRGPEGQLAGTTLTLIQAVRNLHQLGVPLEGAFGAATTVPAAVCGRPDLGHLRPGAVADIVVLEDDLTVKRVLVGGETVVES